ncbi:MAG: hypothetical protein CM1200mP18_00490 [Gammaproteobacteria bacterium]|nr:MAG: hypothetical protein CM1200mP18_00490 [Gammaproteobacteria bacterium]
MNLILDTFQSMVMIFRKSLRGRSAMLSGVVPQDTVLFNDTIYYNIAYGDPNAEERHVYEAARTARIHDFIPTALWLSDPCRRTGFEALGGEKQRVALPGRLKNPLCFSLTKPPLLWTVRQKPIYKRTWRNIQRTEHSSYCPSIVNGGLGRSNSGSDRGQITEQGPHQQLLAQGGLYAGLWQEQEKERVRGQPTNILT